MRGRRVQRGSIAIYCYRPRRPGGQNARRSVDADCTADARRRRIVHTSDIYDRTDGLTTCSGTRPCSRSATCRAARARRLTSDSLRDERRMRRDDHLARIVEQGAASNRAARDLARRVLPRPTGRPRACPRPGPPPSAFSAPPGRIDQIGHRLHQRQLCCARSYVPRGRRAGDVQRNVVALGQQPHQVRASPHPARDRAGCDCWR